MESCESPVISGTDDGLSLSTSQQQQCPSQPWNSLSNVQVPPGSQTPSLEPLSLSASYPSKVQGLSVPHKSLKEQQQSQSPPVLSASSIVSAIRHQQSGNLGLQEEDEGVGCGEEEDEELDDLDEMEIDGCFPSLLPIDPEEGAMPTLVRQRQVQRRGMAESGSEEEEGEESSDVENLAGEIVYQPDGSAYVVESLSQLIQSDGGAVSSLLPANSLPGMGKLGETAGTSPSVYPQIINTFHIASSFAKWFGPSDQGFPSTSSLAGLSPVLHSFRVFDVRHKSNKDYLNSDGSAKKSCVSKDVPNNVDFSKFDGLALYGKGKPILMCFLCKLSFGYARSFVTHAVHDHRMTLNENERRLLGHKHASAIIQGIGKDKEPLISFLEPKNRSSPSPPMLMPLSSGQSFYGTFSGVHLDPGSNGRGSEALLSKDSDLDLKQSPLGPLLTLGALGSPKSSSLTSVSDPAKDSSAQPPQSGRADGLAGRDGTPRGGDRERDSGEGRGLVRSMEAVSGGEEVSLEEGEDEEGEEGPPKACGSSGSVGGEGGRPAVSNQSVSKSLLLMPSSSLQPSGRCPAASPTHAGRAASSASSSSRTSEGGASADDGGRSSEPPFSFNCQGASLPMPGAATTSRGGKDDIPACSPGSASPPLPPHAASDESANQDSATAPEPNHSPAEGEEDSGALLHHHHHHLHHHLHLHPHGHGHSHPHPGMPCDLTGVGDCPQNHGAGGSGVECPKCDTVLGSSRSLGGHMTMMHSRNSCKTLKCPKCNWHYKYQQTLEAHMKEKHPDSGGSCMYCSTGQSHPRLARGESYTCGYKPFRCEVCNYSTTTKGNLSIHMQSDKHLNNMQTLQNGGSVPASGEQVFGHAPGGVVPVPPAAQPPVHPHHPAQSAGHVGGACGAPSPTKPKSKPMWRCEVCDYETNVARNLRIHMTSEKHMHNVMLLQQNVAQIQHGRLGLGGLPSPSEAELYQYYLSQNMNLSPGLKMDPSGADAQFLLSGFHLDPSMVALGPSLGGDIPMDMRLAGGPLVSEELMTLGESLSQTSDPSLKLFQCAVCNRFTTDNLDVLGLHMGAERTLPEDEWRATVGDSHQCKLCRYTTQLKANFQLHCKTDKHVQKYQLVAHIKEGGKGNEWRLKCVAIGNPVHLKCNACDYYTNSLEKLRLHTVSSRHEASLKLYKHLQQHESAVEGDTGYYHCALCNYSTKAKLNLIQHVRSMKHQRCESLHKLQRLQKGLPEEEDELGTIFTIVKCPSADTGELSEDVEAAGETAADQEDQTKDRESGGEKETSRAPAACVQAERDHTDSPVSSKRPPSKSAVTEGPLSSKCPKTAEKSTDEQTQVYQCPYCKYSNGDLNRMRMHVMTQHSVQPLFRCPLCQDMLNSKVHLQLHLTHLHSVAPDCVNKLIASVTPSEVLPESMLIPVPGPERDGQTASQNITSSGLEDLKKQTEALETECEKRPLQLTEIAEAHKSTLEEQSTKEDTAGFLCWKKGCSQVFKSSSALQLHFGEVHNKRPQLPVSERHVYKYRCNQCSLAFKTVEKLQLHSQYHVIRAATMCCLCQRSFRTLQALKKHLETSHLELSDADIQQLYGGLLMNGDLMVIGDTSPGEDQGALGEDDREGEESEPDEKQSPIGSDSGSIQEDAGSEPKRALPFRKGPNFTMEKFLDPSRPFKCTVCKESFTQKNILLVHYNSVSHLHKVKRALQESSAGQPELTNSPDNKPFKCSTCSVAYSQSSTLEIHMRSVLHQTKARAAKLEAAGGSSCSVSSVSGSGSGSAVGISNPNPNSTATSTATSSNSSSTSSVQTVQSILGGNHMNQTHSTESPGNASVPSNPRPPENSDSKKKKFPDMLSSRGQQQHLQHQQLAQAQAQAQLQQELQQQAALIQSQLFNPALLQHFPMATEALLQLQQQQLLFPFYIPGAEFQLNPEMNLNSSALSLASSSANSLLEDLKNSAQQVQQSCLQQQLLHHHLQQQHQPQAHSQATSQMALLQQNASLLHQGEKKPKSFLEKDCDGQKEKELNEKGEDHSSKDSLENTKSKDKKDQAMVSGNPDPNFLPPRIASDARGNATKALLENFGFELVIQYNENKQKVQKKSSGSGHVGCNGPIGVTRVVDPVEGLEKLECEACGKLFSNILILKSHQEHIHQAFFPFHSLERFAKEYREQYDKLYPLRPQTPEAAPPPAPPPLPPPPPPPQRASTPNIPVSAPSLTPPAIPAPQPPVSMTQIPMPMDLPIFPPIMMQSMSLQSIPTQVPAHLPSVEPSLASDLAQLYQQQLTPAMLQQQQQNKRPRTRITDDQLRVLRQYFDINNSPNEDQVKEMADKSGLPQKVIKHWFRNTLFKERQRNKDSPYNFNNPPITTLEETKVDSKPPSPEPQRYDYYGSKRSSRTRFTDYQLRVLQDFFDTNAYPKDDEFEQLSNLLNLPTRVIVVWFQNARQKARKNYENQGEGAKEGDRRELSNDRYIRTTNLNYQCKKCSLVFQRIFDLIKHQKKLCYKDEDDEGLYDSQNEDSVDFSNECYTPTGPSSSSLCPFSSSTSAFSHNTSSEKDEASPSHVSHSFGEKSKQSGDTSEPREDQRPIKQESLQQPQSETQLQRLPRDEQTQATPKTQTLLSPTSQQKQQTSPSVSQASPAPLQSSHMILNPVLPSASQQQSQQLSQQIVPYHCEQCKLGFPSFEHWQEHQQLHFLTVQNQFIHPQFLDRTMDMPFMLFDPSNPLLASQLFSGTMPQISAGSTNSPTTPPSTLNSLKRKLEEKPGISPGENDSANSGEEPQRDKRLRTTITPEQLEILYQKYLLDSNPTRKMLDHIAHEVGLKKRVVQVWFQNTRARERKGQFRAVGPAQAHRRCPFCRALFKAKTALEAHIRSRHWHEAKRAGYSLALASMLPDQEGKLDPLDISSFSQHISLNNDGHCSLSPVSKSMDLLPHALLSPGAIKVEGIEDFESPAMSSVNLTFDQNKLDNDDCSSVNTAITDTTTGDEAIADNDSSDAKQGHYSNDFLSKSGGAVPSLENDFLSKSGGAVPSLENDDQMSSELVSPATSSYAKDFENETVVDYSETSSLADPCSPSPGASGSRSIDSGDRPGQKRFRTQMTNLQLKLLKSCFNDYRTPTMLECEVLGSDIGLPKRVVQVWFQNARAKEKKAKLSMAKHFGINQTPYEGPKTECTLCGVKYSARTSVRDHIFSQQHISKVKETIGNQLDKEKEYFDPATVRQLMAQQEIDRIKKANEVLGLAQQQAMQQPGMFDNPALQALNLSSAYPTLQGIPPVLLPGVGNPSLPGFTSSNTALTPPKPPNLNMPGSSVPSLSLPTSGLPNKPPISSSLASPSPVQTSNSTLQSTPTTTSTTMQLGPRPEHPSPERLREKEKPKDKSEKLSTPSSTGVTSAPSTSAANAKKDKADTAVLATSMLTPGMEYVVDPAQLQALQAALGSDPTALLTSQFLPYFMPGFSPYYSPQIPGALQGGYLQPMYSMESLFPYNPALSQALMGLSPGSLLQHYQQYQQSLQEALQQQQQRQLQQQQKQQQVQLPKASQTPTSHQPPGTPDCKEFAKDGVKGEEQKGIPSSEASSSSHKNLLSEQQKVNNKGVDPFLEQYIVPKVPCRLACRKCQAVFTKEEVAIGHLKSICFFGQSVSNPQELLLRVPSGGNAGDGSLYDCLVCNTTLDGDKVLSQHLESALHKHRTIKRTARNAKEHATSLLPLSSACFLDPDTTSTSQSATLSNNSPPPLPVTSATMPSSSVSSSSCSSSSTATSPHTAAGKPWAQAPSSRALARKPNSASSLNASPFPPGSSPSTVTSSSLSTSGVQTSIPTDVFTDESDSESSQRSAGRMGHPAEEAQQPSCLKDNSCNSNLASV